MHVTQASLKKAKQKTHSASPWDICVTEEVTIKTDGFNSN